MAEIALLRNTHSTRCTQLWPWEHARLARHSEKKYRGPHPQALLYNHSNTDTCSNDKKDTHSAEQCASFTHSEKQESPLGCVSLWPAPATAHMALIYEQWPRRMTCWMGFLTLGGESMHVKWHVPRGAMKWERKTERFPG